VGFENVPADDMTTIAAQSDFELRLPARAENVALVRHALNGFVRELGCTEDRVANMLLAVTEACTNVVLHAYREMEGLLEVAARRGGEEVTVTVRDRGTGMTPRVDSPGLGLGLPLIMSVSDGVDIRNARDGGTEIEMRFQLREDDAA
jgi:serine/threonine-protein kinase RsbW